jgi:uncharacterized protein (TIGR03067 family)
MRPLLAPLALVLAVSVAPAQDPGKLDGVWKVQAAEAGGTKVPAEAHKDFTLTLDGDSFVARLGADEIRRGTFKADATKKPGTMDVKVGSGPDKDKTQLLIFSLEGDTLKLCGGPPGEDRPRTFDTNGKPKLTCLTLTREK